jgi:hypothetical protein
MNQPIFGGESENFRLQSLKHLESYQALPFETGMIGAGVREGADKTHDLQFLTYNTAMQS